MKIIISCSPGINSVGQYKCKHNVNGIWMIEFSSIWPWNSQITLHEFPSAWAFDIRRSPSKQNWTWCQPDRERQMKCKRKHKNTILLAERRLSTEKEKERKGKREERSKTERENHGGKWGLCLTSIAEMRG